MITEIALAILYAAVASAEFSVSSYQWEGCANSKLPPDFTISPLPRDTCVWFPTSEGSLSFSGGLNNAPEYYAAGTASGSRGVPTTDSEGAIGCGYHSVAGGDADPNYVYQDAGVCQQHAQVAGFTFDGCLDYANWYKQCLGWVMVINCVTDVPSNNVSTCLHNSNSADTFGDGTGSVSAYDRYEVGAGPSDRAREAEYLFGVVDRAKTGASCFNEYSDIALKKDHPKAMKQYCNGTDHVTVLDQGTVITRHRHADCYETRGP